MSFLLHKRRKDKNIKGQVKLLEKPSAALFSWVFRCHVKETVKMKKEFKEIWHRKRPEQSKQSISKDTSFSKQDRGGSQHYQLSTIIKDNVTVIDIKTEVFARKN